MARRPGILADLPVLLVAALVGCTSRPSGARADGPVDGGHDADAEAGLPDATDADAEDADADATAPEGGYELASFAGGFDDSFSLPPRFAPLLQLSGAEVTREPPGMYDPASPEFFSYAVLWWLTGAPELTTQALRDDVFIYYTGLCGGATVTLDEPLAPGANDAGIGLARRGSLDLDYCLGQAIPAALRLEVWTYDCPDHDAVLLLLTPQAESSAVAGELRRIQTSFRCW